VDNFIHDIIDDDTQQDNNNENNNDQVEETTNKDDDEDTSGNYEEGETGAKASSSPKSNGATAETPAGVDPSLEDVTPQHKYQTRTKRK